MNLNIILVEAQKSLDDGKLDDAKKKFIKALKKAPTNIDILNVLASIELHLGNKTKALDLLRRSSLLKPNQSEITLNMAICQIELGDFDGSLETINKAIALYPSNPKLYFKR